MKQIFRPALKLWRKSISSNNNPVVIKGRGKTTIGFGIGFWVAYLLFKGFRRTH